MGVSAKEYRFYVENRYLRKQDSISILLSHWYDLQLLYEKINKYKKNRKPVSAPILKRSIFD